MSCCAAGIYGVNFNDAICAKMHVLSFVHLVRGLWAFTALVTKAAIAANATHKGETLHQI